jgi:hypothetical protein
MSTGTIVDGKIVTGKNAKGEGLPPSEVKASGSGKSKKKYRVIINQQDGPDGKYDVPLGVNGVVNLVKRGEEVVLDEDYFNVLKDAKIDRLVRNPGEEEQTITVARFSYTVLGEVN